MSSGDKIDLNRSKPGDKVKLLEGKKEKKTGKSEKSHKYDRDGDDSPGDYNNNNSSKGGKSTHSPSSHPKPK